jgi:hypothetical protein
MNREERHLCAILHHLLTDTENLRAFQNTVGLELRDDTEVFLEAAFVRDYFNWCRDEHRRLRKGPEEFDAFCHEPFGIVPGLASASRAPDGFLSLRALRGTREAFDDEYCAALPKLANMKLDLLLLTPDTFAVIEAKLHSPVQASQIHLQQVLGRILNRLPGYERHTFRHFLISNGSHPKLRHRVALCEPRVDLSLQECSWEHILKSLPCIAPRHLAEIQKMLAPTR